MELSDGVQLMKSEIFYPTANRSIRKGDMMVLHRELGWKKYYGAMPADGCYFKAREEVVSFIDEVEKHPHRV